MKCLPKERPKKKIMPSQRPPMKCVLMERPQKKSVSSERPLMKCLSMERPQKKRLPSKRPLMKCLPVERPFNSLPTGKSCLKINSKETSTHTVEFITKKYLLQGIRCFKKQVFFRTFRNKIITHIICCVEGTVSKYFFGIQLHRRA